VSTPHPTGGETPTASPVLPEVLREVVTSARQALAEAEERSAAAANTVEPGTRSYAFEVGYLRGELEALIDKIEPYAAPEQEDQEQ
jgi:hypothetical protein